MLNANTLKNAIISGANLILNNKTIVDELNIFPVPDGDTGTNMSMTISAAKDELLKIQSENVGNLSKMVSSAMLRGARGNSGVILSLLFKGISKGFADKAEVSAQDIVDALAVGVEDAYKAVMKPTEGTMLTVARVAYEYAKDALEETDDVVEIWEAACQGAEDALEDTPRLLPVLKKAGVVDAGGKGLCLIFEGMYSVFSSGEIIEISHAEENNSNEDDFFSNAAAEFDQEINFTYCTECIIQREDFNKDPLELRQYLMTIGDSVLVADDDDIIKVHVHTENPGNALEKGLEFGALLIIKIENMKEQHRQAAEANELRKSQKVSFEHEDPTEEYGFVAVAAGEGLEELFRDLGCANIVSGGQTMNPSTEDIYAAAMATGAKTVYVLPNNKNIILAAEQAVPMATDRRIVVVPTRTIPQGITALLTFNPDDDIETNVEQMLDAASAVKTGQVTFAARDSEFGGHKIKQNDILSLDNGKLEFIEKDPVNAAYKLIRSMADKSTSFITIIYGNEITEEQANSLLDRLQIKYKDIEFTLVNGAQPVYYFIISIE